MQIVELKVQVDKSQLTALESEVKALQGQVITLKTATSGAGSRSGAGALAGEITYAKEAGRVLSQQEALRRSGAKKTTMLLKEEERTRQEHLRQTGQITKSQIVAEQKERDRAFRAEQTRLKAQAQQAKDASRERVQLLRNEQADKNNAFRKQMADERKLAAEQRRAGRSGIGSAFGTIGKVAEWTAITGAVYGTIGAFKSALSTMKDVDSELVTVRKVTGFNKQQMEEIEQQAYKTASAYGVAADQYVSSVAAFARAGYKEQSAGLAELSIKTQIVGDTTADVANQFLLATDAAYGYKGNVQELQRVLDGANEIDNKYATSIEKIAEGMGIVAPVAAQARVGVDELMAGIGTITAVTQRSGSESARALRALFLNILGDTKTEIDEGVTWTTGEIKGLQDVLRKFAPDVVAAAEATGEVINPMEAMSALAKAMKEGVMTEQDLMQLVSDIGGKLRSSQLLALIQNWDMYESMLTDFKNAAGSADKEVENAMDSWERKTEVLKNTWTQFVSNLVDTDMIKGGLDKVTGFVEALDSDMGHMAIKAAAFALAFAGIAKAIKGIAELANVAKIGALLKDVPLFLSAFGEIAAQQGVIAALGQSFGMLGSALGPIGIALAGIAAVIAGVKLVDFFDVDYDEQIEKVEALRDKWDELYGTESEYQELVKKRSSADGLSDWEKTRLDYLKEYRSELKQAIQDEETLAKQKYHEKYERQDQSSLDDDYYRNGGKGHKENERVDVSNLKKAKAAFDELNESVRLGKKGPEEYKAGLQGILDTYDEFYQDTQKGIEGGWLHLEDLEKPQQDLFKLLQTMEKLSGMEFDMGDLDLQIAAQSFDKISEIGEKSAINWQALKNDLIDAGASAEDLEGTLAQLQADDTVVLIDVRADDAETTLQNMEKLGLAVKEADGWKVNIDGFVDMANDLGLSHDQAVALASAMGEIDGVEFVDAEGNVADFAKAMENAGSPIQNLVAKIDDLVTSLREFYGLDAPEIDIKTNAQKVAQDVAEAAKKASELDGKTSTTTIDADAGPANAEIEHAESEAREFADGDYTANVKAKDNATSVINPAWALARGYNGPYTATLKAVDNATSIINRAVGALKNFVSKRITLTTVHTNAYTGTDTKDYRGHATGALRFSGGDTLLGDELSPNGTPRPELVITPGQKAFLAGTAGPTYATLPAGSRIYNWADTMQILSGGDMVGLVANSKGNDAISRAINNRNNKPAQAANNASNANKGNNAAKNANKAKGGGNNAKKGNNAANKANKAKGGGGAAKSSSSSGSKEDAKLEALHDELALLEAQYDLLEAQNAPMADLIAKSKEIQDKYHETNEYLRAAGKEEKEQVENSTKWLQERQKQIDLEKDKLSLLRAEYDLMEAQGATPKELIKKEKEIQNQLHRINNQLRAANGNQEDIIGNSKAWLEELEKIHKIQRQIYQDQRTLLQTEIEIMEYQGAAAADRIKKLRKIQDQLHREANYMRSIKGDQAEINELSIEWYRTQDKILQIQEDLMNELDSAIQKRLKDTQKERDAELSIIDARIEAMQKEHDLAQKQLDIEERRKAVEEARIALENAQNQRRVRYYNAATGQFEWGADAQTVRSAQEAYDDAKKDLEDDEKEREFDARIEELELQKEEINRRYDQLEARWDRLTDLFSDPLRSIEEILKELVATGKLTQGQAQMVKNLIGDIEQYTAYIWELMALRARSPDESMEDYIQFLNTWLEENGNTDEAMEMAREAISQSGASTAAAWAAYEAAAAAGKDLYASTGSSATTGASVAAKAAAREAAAAKSSSGSSSSSSGGASAAARAAAKSAAGTSGSSSPSYSSPRAGGATAAARDAAKAAASLKKKTYDSGGVLHGLGGIKATISDEAVIPPDITKKMLSPVADKRFKRRMAELGFIYGYDVPPGTPGFSGGAGSSNNHYGDIYQYGDIKLTEAQAKSMTVYDLAQMSRGLSTHSAN